MKKNKYFSIAFLAIFSTSFLGLFLTTISNQLATESQQNASSETDNLNQVSAETKEIKTIPIVELEIL